VTHWELNFSSITHKTIRSQEQKFQLWNSRSLEQTFVPGSELHRARSESSM